MVSAWVNALLGGALIGVAVSVMLFLKGRVTGISGILYRLFARAPGEGAWRWFFVAGLLAGGVLLQLLRPESFGSGQLPADGKVFLAGLLVGFGTVLGGGCTSGHGICGISRLSPRSMVATLLFMGAGMVTVALLRWSGVLS